MKYEIKGAVIILWARHLKTLVSWKIVFCYYWLHWKELNHVILLQHNHFHKLSCRQVLKIALKFCTLLCTCIDQKITLSLQGQSAVSRDVKFKVLTEKVLKQGKTQGCEIFKLHSTTPLHFPYSYHWDGRKTIKGILRAFIKASTYSKTYCMHSFTILFQSRLRFKI